MLLIDDRCCPECWDSIKYRCHDLVDCMTTGPLCHDRKECREKTSKRTRELRRDQISRPVIFIGAGTCGLGAGAQKTIDAVRAWLKDKAIEADVVETGCIGFCSVEPIMDVQLPGKARLSLQQVTGDVATGLLETVFSNQIPEEKHILCQFRNENHEAWNGVPFMDEHPFFSAQKRWVLANCGRIDPTSIEEYIAFGGYRALSKALGSMTPAQICEEVKKAGLRGRGGGGFPTGLKWELALKQNSDQKYLICNADEGDPGAFMDRAVIEGDPHRVLEGMMIAAYAIGASKAYVYIRAEYPLAIKRLKEAISQAQAYGFLGENILDSGFSLQIFIKMGAGAFVCGEETALMHSIEGKRGMPSPRPPYPSERGLFGKPSVINNVETYANVSNLISNGADLFSSIGTERSKGTKVFALSGRVTNTGLVEVPMGTSIRFIVNNIGGGIPNGKKFKAVQIGGPSGGCIPDSHLDILVDYEELKKVGAMMGSGGLVVMDESTCMVDLAKFFMDFIQRESCGKCIPCREGTRRMLEILESITRGRRSEKGSDALLRFQGIMTLTELAEVIRDSSLCGLGQSAPNPVLSTLHWFRDEYEAHIFERRCPAQACKDLLTFTIDQEKCKGCTLCAKKCPNGAIMGAVKTPHYIIPDKCISCGTCKEVCRHNAVQVQ